MGTPYTREENWLGEQGRLIANYFPFRSGVVLAQFIQAGLYPSVAAPSFNQQGGRVALGFSLTMTAPTGSIYYTTDGSDPRVYGVGSLSPSARLYSSALSQTNDLVVKARVLNAGTWSALNEAAFTASGMGVPIRITELMYNPVGGDIYQFIELQNIGATPVDMSGFSLDGVTYVFPAGTILAPGGVLVLAPNDNPSAFASRYPGVVVSGYYSGHLAHNGQRIALLDQNSDTVIAVNYKNSGGWPAAANGGGYSLEIMNPNGDPDDPANWRASAAVNGSPGIVNMVTATNGVGFNEIMAGNAGAVTNGSSTTSDWLELYNSTTNSISLSDWSLSNSGNVRKYVFPSGTSVPGGGYFVVWCDNRTNDPGLHSGFTLGRKGENLFLYDALTNRVDAFSFGLQLTNYSLGRVGPGASWQLNLPTPGTANLAANVGSATNLAINEWLANSPAGGADWLELYNRSTNRAVALAGLYLATSNELFQIRSLSFIPPLGHVQLFADKTAGFDHLDFKLTAAGDAIVLYDCSGQELDRVSFVNQIEGVSQGRLPDGSSTIVSFPVTASPGAPNYVTTYDGPCLNELMARNVSAVSDARGNNPNWVELYNPTATDVSLAGMGLTKDSTIPMQWTFPAEVTITANGYLVVWCDSTRPPTANGTTDLNTGFNLSGDGDMVYLVNTNGQIADSVAFGPQIPDRSIGRNGGVWNLLASPTPGLANAMSAALGNPSNLRVNEWMAAPGAGDDDWFELYNADSLPVILTGLYLSDDPTIAGMTNFLVPALSFIAGHGWAQYVADSHPSRGPNHVSFSLNKDGDTIRVYAPDRTLIDAVDFGLQATDVSQGRLPDGSTNIVSFVNTPTPGAANTLSNNPPVLNVISNRLGNITFTFDSWLGESYQLQYKNGLADPQWISLGTSVPGTGGPLILTDSLTAQPQRFYRLLVTAQ